MKLASVEAIAAALEEAEVRYLVVGGLAVAIHGYGRATKDIDLVIQLERDNVESAFEALGKQGYRPKVPVTGAEFADKATRESWIHNKNMEVMQFISDWHRDSPIDIFVWEPFDFEEEMKVAVRFDLPNKAVLPVVSRDTLIKLKLDANRPQDLADVARLTGNDPRDIDT